MDDINEKKVQSISLDELNKVKDDMLREKSIAEGRDPSYYSDLEKNKNNKIVFDSPKHNDELIPIIPSSVDSNNSQNNIISNENINTNDNINDQFISDTQENSQSVSSDSSSLDDNLDDAFIDDIINSFVDFKKTNNIDSVQNTNLTDNSDNYVEANLQENQLTSDNNIEVNSQENQSKFVYEEMPSMLLQDNNESEKENDGNVLESDAVETTKIEFTSPNNIVVPIPVVTENANNNIDEQNIIENTNNVVEPVITENNDNIVEPVVTENNDNIVELVVTENNDNIVEPVVTENVNNDISKPAALDNNTAHYNQLRQPLDSENESVVNISNTGTAGLHRIDFGSLMNNDTQNVSSVPVSQNSFDNKIEREIADISKNNYESALKQIPLENNSVDNKVAADKNQNNNDSNNIYNSLFGVNSQLAQNEINNPIESITNYDDNIDNNKPKSRKVVKIIAIILAIVLIIGAGLFVYFKFFKKQSLVYAKSLELSLSQTTFYEGDYIDLSAQKVIINWSDGSSEIKTMTDCIADLPHFSYPKYIYIDNHGDSFIKMADNLTTEEERSFTISFGGQTSEKKIIVNAIEKINDVSVVFTKGTTYAEFQEIYYDDVIVIGTVGEGTNAIDKKLTYLQYDLLSSFNNGSYSKLERIELANNKYCFIAPYIIDGFDSLSFRIATVSDSIKTVEKTVSLTACSISRIDITTPASETIYALNSFYLPYDNDNSNIFNARIYDVLLKVLKNKAVYATMNNKSNTKIPLKLLYQLNEKNYEIVYVLDTTKATEYLQINELTEFDPRLYFVISNKAVINGIETNLFSIDIDKKAFYYVMDYFTTNTYKDYSLVFTSCINSEISSIYKIVLKRDCIVKASFDYVVSYDGEIKTNDEITLDATTIGNPIVIYTTEKGYTIRYVNLTNTVTEIKDSLNRVVYSQSGAATSLPETNTELKLKIANFNIYKDVKRGYRFENNKFYFGNGDVCQNETVSIFITCDAYTNYNLSKETPWIIIIQTKQVMLPA